MKVLIYGGSFDPVHKGHAALLKAALAQIKPDYTHIFTARHSPFKQSAAASFELRQKMATGALGRLGKNIIFDDFERRQNRMVYAWETVKYIRGIYPHAQVYLLVGSDCLNEMRAWKNTEYIFKNAVIAAGARKGFAFTTKDFDFILLKGCFPQISSSRIKLDIMCGGVVPAEAPPQTARFIESNQMYGLNIHKWLAAKLKPKRYLHVKLVAGAAADLAREYNASAERAALAALLHDAAKTLDDNALARYCRGHKLKVRDFNDICRYGAHLLHGPVSADMAKRIFGVKDKEILCAIANHTLGAKNMGALEKILFIADMASKDRKYKDARAVRGAAKKSLDEGVLAAMAIKMNFTIQTRKWIAPAGPELWNELISKQN